MGAEDKRTVKAGDNMLAVINALQRHDGARVTELAEDLGLAASTVHSHLATLESNRYVVREGDFYHLSLRFLHVGKYVSSRKPVYTESERIVSKLAERTDERAFFIVEEHGRGIVLHKSTGKNAVDVPPYIGQYVYLHNTSVGKAILADLPRSRVEDIFEQWGLPQETERTITERERLLGELDGIAEKGYAMTMGERISDLKSIACSVSDREGRVVGGLSVSGPQQRLDDEWETEELKSLIVGAAKELEMNISNV
jgi:DNA-binding IclR family transcriptional regulator